MNRETRDNLLEAMHGEAFAFAKYTLYARQARAEGHEELARLYEKAADVELNEHFREEADLVGLVGSDEDNLRDAIEGESYEVDTMYEQFAEQAAAAAEAPAAERFREVRDDEVEHRRLFQAALATLDR